MVYSDGMNDSQRLEAHRVLRRVQQMLAATESKLAELEQAIHPDVPTADVLNRLSAVEDVSHLRLPPL